MPQDAFSVTDGQDEFSWNRFARRRIAAREDERRRSIFWGTGGGAAETWMAFFGKEMNRRMRPAESYGEAGKTPGRVGYPQICAAPCVAKVKRGSERIVADDLTFMMLTGHVHNAPAGPFSLLSLTCRRNDAAGCGYAIVLPALIDLRIPDGGPFLMLIDALKECIGERFEFTWPIELEELGRKTAKPSAERALR